MMYRRLFLYPITCFNLLASLAIAQQKINILIFYEDQDSLPAQSIDSAIKFLSQNSGEGVTVNQKYVMSLKAGSDVEAMVNATCNIVDGAITAAHPPHIVLDTTKAGILSETVKSFTRAMGLPTYSASYGQPGDLREWRDLTDQEKQYLVQIVPPGDIMVQSIRDIVRLNNITNAAIIYDSTFVLDYKYKSLLQNLPCRHIMVIAEATDDALRAQTKRLKDADIVNFFIVGNLATIRGVLSAGTANMMFGRKYSWYSISKEQDDIGCGCDNATNVHLRPSFTTDITNRLQTLKTGYGLTALPAVEAIFYFDFALRAFKAAGSLLGAGKFTNFAFLKCSAFDEANPPKRAGLNLKDSLKQITMTDSFGPITWGDNGMTFPSVDMTMDKFFIMKGKVDRKVSMGMWDSGMPGSLMFKSGLNLTNHLAVTVYSVTSVIQAPFIMKRVVNGTTEFYGYCIDLINEIKNIIKFEYEISEVPDGKFGTMNENSQFDGMIKELIEKRADIALGSLSVMAERENVIDFTVPYYDLVGITIMMKKPKTPTSLFKFLTVLEAEVWICILVAYGCTSILLWIFDWFSPYSYQNNKDKYKDDDEKREFTLKECLWFCMTSLTPQGGGEAPKNLSGRLVAATWWLFGFIIIASYTANLAAFLTVSRLDTPIESLTDLANQYKVQYAPVNGTSTMTYFERMAYIEKKFYEIWKDMSLNDSMSDVERAKLAVWDYPVSDKYTKMWQSMQEAGLPATFQDALARVRSSVSTSEGFAYLGDATDIRYQVLTNCDLQIVGEEFSRKPYAIAVQQGSPLKDQFNDAILKLLNQRKLETLKERWWNQNPEKKECEKEDDQSDGISIENIGGVFIVIFVGIGLACITLAFEYWWYKGRKGVQSIDSGMVVPVKPYKEPVKKKPKFSNDKSNFDTEYKTNAFGIAPVPNPW